MYDMDESRWERGKESWERYLFNNYYGDGDCNDDCENCTDKDCVHWLEAHKDD